MAILKSDKFSKIDAELDNETATKLEFCAAGFPSQVQSHFSTKQNSTGAPVRKLQEALVEIQAKDPSLKLRTFSVNGVYDANFANAVEDYKRARNIKNFANAIDNVVGIKTIITMDGELKGSPPVEPVVSKVKADVVIRIQGDIRVEDMTNGIQVLPSNVHRSRYNPVDKNSSDKVLVNDASGRFLLLDGRFTQKTDERIQFEKILKNIQDKAKELGVAIDRVYLYGSSAGGRNVLDFAGRAETMLGKLTMIGVADAHFTQLDTSDRPKDSDDLLSDENTPEFRLFSNTFTKIPSNRFNFFQLVGNRKGKRLLGFGDDFFTSNFGGEIHGKVSNYVNEKLDVSEASKEAHKNGDDKPAHDDACRKGLNRMEGKILSDLFSVLPNE